MELVLVLSNGYRDYDKLIMIGVYIENVKKLIKWKNEIIVL